MPVHVRHQNDVDDPHKFMQCYGHVRALQWFGASTQWGKWCLDMSEHWNSPEDSLEVMQCCLSMLEHWNGVEHPFKVMQGCSTHLRALKCFEASTFMKAVDGAQVTGHSNVLTCLVRTQCL